MAKQPAASQIETLEPKPVWRFFAGMTAVPRSSKSETKIRAYVRDAAAKRGLTVHEDEIGNIVIDVPATAGHENAPITVLQGHLDMVCEANSGTDVDFDNDPIRPLIDVDKRSGETIVRADGTTLGADNGIGVAMAFAAATEPDVIHGPLELLCTIDEEAGMSGAKGLTPDSFKGRRLINLDSEEDDAIYIGCAGGADVTLRWQLTTQPLRAEAEVCRVTVAGLRGGHSGGDIHLNRANAIKLLARTLRGADLDHLHLATINGGSMRNAIPREASAVLAGPAGAADALRRSADIVQRETIDAAGEAKCKVRVEMLSANDAARVASDDDSRRVLDALAALPSGVLAVVPEIAGLVQTSNNVSTISSTSPSAAGSTLDVEVGCLSRSSSATQVRATIRQISAIGRLGGAAVELGNDYPGWEPNFDSATLATCRQVYEQLFGEAPGVTAIHAGLECGIIGERIGGMDMVSFGPRIEGAHSPDERVYVASVQKSWKLLKAVLAELARG